jgi:hypothetical protein
MASAPFFKKTLRVIDMLYSARAISPFLKAHHGSTRIKNELPTLLTSLELPIENQSPLFSVPPVSVVGFFAIFVEIPASP